MQLLPYLTLKRSLWRFVSKRHLHCKTNMKQMVGQKANISLPQQLCCILPTARRPRSVAGEEKRWDEFGLTTAAVKGNRPSVWWWWWWGGYLSAVLTRGLFESRRWLFACWTVSCSLTLTGVRQRRPPSQQGWVAGFLLNFRIKGGILVRMVTDGQC